MSCPTPALLRPSRLHRRAAWLALLLVWLGAVLPALAHWHPTPTAPAWGQICSSPDTRPGDGPAPQGPGSAQADCPLCLIPLHHPGLPTPTGAMPWGQPRLRTAAPRSPEVPELRAPDHLTPPPRAPPWIS